MRNIALVIAFDGRAYHGWQYQNNAPTVQQAMEEAVFSITGERVRITGCSRTDAGVHANRFVLNFNIAGKIPIERVPFALNSRLPRDIAVLEAYEAAPAFNVRFDCKGKEYVYKILNRPLRDPFLPQMAWHVPYPLDLDAMKEGGGYLVGRNDFAAFMAQGSPVKSTVRTIKYLNVERAGDTVSISIYGDGFLYNMVRIITGTLLWVGRGKTEPSEVAAILDAKERALAGPTAPPDGLYLNRVDY